MSSEDEVDYRFFDSEDDHHDHVFCWFDWQSGVDCYNDDKGCGVPQCPRCSDK